MADLTTSGTAVSGARASMASLISALRGMTNTSSGDYLIGNTTFWTDQQLQDVLDRRRYEVREEVLQPFGNLQSDGSTSYFDYQSEFRWFEATSGGTARFIIQNAAGSVIPSGWSANYEHGLITFTTDQEGYTRQLTGYAFDVYGAAADVWRQKAGHAAEKIDFSTDNHSVKRSHVVDNCLQMANRYAQMSGVPVQEGNTATAVRSDLE